MSVVLDKVPEGNWLCEECLLEAKTEKGDQDKVQKAARTSKASSMPEIMKISGNASTFRCKGGLKLNLKDSGVKEIRRKKVNSSSLFPAKKSASNMEAVMVTTRAIETSVKLPGASRTFRRRLLHGDSSFKNSGKMKMKPAHQVNSLYDQSSNYISENALILAISGDKSPQLQLQSQLQWGKLILCCSL